MVRGCVAWRWVMSTAGVVRQGGRAAFGPARRAQRCWVEPRDAALPAPPSLLLLAVPLVHTSSCRRVKTIRNAGGTPHDPFGWGKGGEVGRGGRRAPTETPLQAQ